MLVQAFSSEPTVERLDEGVVGRFARPAEVEDSIAALCIKSARGAEAMAIICTNMRGALVAPPAEAETGVPVLDSVAVTLWGCLTRTGVPMEELQRFGSVFSLAPDSGA